MNVIDILFEQRSFKTLDSQGGHIFKKIPHLPHQLMDFLVDILPAIFFAFGILNGALGAIVLITVSSFLTHSFSLFNLINPFYLLVNGMLAIANGFLMLLSFTDISHRSLSGWRSLFLINIVSILQAVLSLFFSSSAGLSVAIYIVLTIYITFEFRPYFRKDH